MNNNEEMLHNALKDCMQKEMEEVPKDNEIKKKYTPSNQFKKYMNHLMRREEFKEKNKFLYENRSNLYKLVAGAALIILCMNVGVTLFSPKMSKDKAVENMADESTSDGADTAVESALVQSSLDSTSEPNKENATADTTTADTTTADTTDTTTADTTDTTTTTDSVTDSIAKAATEIDVGILWTADLTKDNEATLKMENKTEEAFTYTNILKV
jgi:BMFP domain-containing protein YqiC